MTAVSHRARRRAPLGCGAGMWRRYGGARRCRHRPRRNLGGAARRPVRAAMRRACEPRGRRPHSRGGRVLTHCNAGALACGYGASVVRARGGRRRVGWERLLGRRLRLGATLGIRCADVLPAPSWPRAVDCVIVAPTVGTATGNKVGTYAFHTASVLRAATTSTCHGAHREQRPERCQCRQLPARHPEYAALYAHHRDGIRECWRVASGSRRRSEDDCRQRTTVDQGVLSGASVPSGHVDAAAVRRAVGAVGPSPCGPCIARCGGRRRCRSLPGLDRCASLLLYAGAAREVVARLKYRNARSPVGVAGVRHGRARRSGHGRRRHVGAHHAGSAPPAWVRPGSPAGPGRGPPVGPTVPAAASPPPRPPQTGRSLAERRRGPLLAGWCRHGGWQRVLLVDDVITSGASLAAAGLALRNAGVARARP